MKVILLLTPLIYRQTDQIRHTEIVNTYNANREIFRFKMDEVRVQNVKITSRPFRSTTRLINHSDRETLPLQWWKWLDSWLHLWLTLLQKTWKACSGRAAGLSLRETTEPLGIETAVYGMLPRLKAELKNPFFLRPTGPFPERVAGCQQLMLRDLILGVLFISQLTNLELRRGSSGFSFQVILHRLPCFSFTLWWPESKERKRNDLLRLRARIKCRNELILHEAQGNP